jgi:hypothetical protein
MKKGCAPITIATGSGFFFSLATSSERHRLGLGMHHGAVIGQVSGTFDRDHGVGDVGRAIGGEVLEKRQLRQVDLVLDDVEHRAFGNHLRIDRGTRFCLIRLMNKRFFTTQQPGDPCPRGKEVGSDLDAVDALEHHQRRPALGGERVDHRRDFLVGGDLVLDHDDVVGKPLAVVLEELVIVLVHADPATFCTRPARCTYPA